MTFGRKSPGVQGQPPSERVRVPAPVLRTRIPSRRGATEQPNATGDGDAPLTLRFWIALVLTGIATGLFGDLLMVVLFNVQHIAFGYHSGSLEHAVEHASDARRITSLAVAGVLGGPAWYLLRRWTKGERAHPEDAMWAGDSRVSFRRCLGSGLISELVVGMGASIGREQAPKVMGAASATVFADRFGLTDGQRRVLLGCGAGSGLGAVYNVPLGGAVFTLEVMLGTMALPAVLPAIACSFIATGVAWLYLPTHATYINMPSFSFSGTIMACSLVMGPFIGLIGAGYIRLIGWVSHHSASGRLAIGAPLVAFSVLGVVGFAYPQLFGNGKDMAHDAFLGHGTILLFLALFALKPIVTSLCLQSGASGGLFTPTLSTGAVLGGFSGLVWIHLWPGAPIGAFALVGAAAMIGAAMQAPLSGVALVLELTHSGFGLMVPMMTATILATVVTRYIDGYSIYTARLPGDE